MRLHAGKFGELALDFLFPRQCVGCGKHTDFICADCIQHFSKINPPLCPLCGRPQSNNLLCPSCVTWHAAIDRIRAPFRFEGTVRQAVYDLKYHNVRALAKPLADLLHQYIIQESITADIIIPIPLHAKRYKERGYNQSSLLSVILGKQTGMTVLNDCLVRRKYTTPQAKTTSLAERQANVTGAFVCSSSAVMGLSVIVIDDVTTSGATFNAAAISLKNAGAVNVLGLSLAKEI